MDNAPAPTPDPSTPAVLEPTATPVPTAVGTPVNNPNPNPIQGLHVRMMQIDGQLVPVLANSNGETRIIPNLQHVAVHQTSGNLNLIPGVAQTHTISLPLNNVAQTTPRANGAPTVVQVHSNIVAGGTANPANTTMRQQWRFNTGFLQNQNPASPRVEPGSVRSTTIPAASTSIQTTSSTPTSTQQRPPASNAQESSAPSSTSTASSEVNNGDASVPDRFKCPICLEIFDHPVSTPCRHSFCRGCLLGAIQAQAHIGGSPDNSQCPMCRANFATLTVMDNRELMHEMRSLQMTCSNEGCDTRCPALEFRQHLQVCSMGTVNCPHAGVGCTSLQKRGDLPQHLSTCPYEAIRGFTSEVTQRLQRSEQQTHGLAHHTNHIGGTVAHFVNMTTALQAQVADLQVQVQQIRATIQAVLQRETAAAAPAPALNVVEPAPIAVPVEPQIPVPAIPIVQPAATNNNTANNTTHNSANNASDSLNNGSADVDRHRARVEHLQRDVSMLTLKCLWDPKAYAEEIVDRVRGATGGINYLSFVANAYALPVLVVAMKRIVMTVLNWEEDSTILRPVFAGGDLIHTVLATALFVGGVLLARFALQPMPQMLSGTITAVILLVVNITPLHLCGILFMWCLPTSMVKIEQQVWQERGGGHPHPPVPIGRHVLPPALALAAVLHACSGKISLLLAFVLLGVNVAFYLLCVRLTFIFYNKFEFSSRLWRLWPDAWVDTCRLTMIISAGAALHASSLHPFVRPLMFDFFEELWPNPPAAERNKANGIILLVLALQFLALQFLPVSRITDRLYPVLFVVGVALTVCVRV